MFTCLFIFLLLLKCPSVSLVIWTNNKMYFLFKSLKLFVYWRIFFLFQRKLNENQELVSILDSCLVLVAHDRSPCVPQILQHVSEDTTQALNGEHLLVLQKVGLTKRQIVAVWLSGIQYSWFKHPYLFINISSIKQFSLTRWWIKTRRGDQTRCSEPPQHKSKQSLCKGMPSINLTLDLLLCIFPLTGFVDR